MQWDVQPFVEYHRTEPQCGRKKPRLVSPPTSPPHPPHALL